jgi:hypothetical protein
MNEVAVEKFHDSRKFGENGSFAAAEVVQTAGQLLHSISNALIWFSCTELPKINDFCLQISVLCTQMLILK